MQTGRACFYWAALAMFSLVLASSAATFTVTNTLESGAGSLRQALENANTNANADVVEFNIPPGGPQKIVFTGDLPTVTSPVTIDGQTQPGFSGTPIIELSGSGQSGFAFYGLRLQSHDNVVRGLVINQFRWHGIHLEPGSSRNRIEGNWIGLDATGKLGLGMNGNGITINGGTNNIIGGTNALARNIISGNTYHGVAIYGSRNIVQGNYIGTDVDGTNAIANGYSFTGTGNFAAGVWVEGSGASTNTIGGSVPGAGNLISGNIRGVALYNQTKGNIVQGNVVGLNSVGNARVTGNQQLTGVYINISDGNLIGGTNSAARNVISGNGKSGAGIEGYGLSIGGSISNLVQGNYIGTDVTGTLGVGNLRAGVWLEYSGNNNTIGGTSVGSRNVISGNGGQGITIWVARDNFVQGNSIGTQADGVTPLGNGATGIHLYNASGNSIGGSTAASGNIIAFNGVTSSGSSGYGVFIGEGSARSTNNLIRRNSIHSNSGPGIRLFDPDCIFCPPFNDTGDGDTGPNNLQNFPVLTNASTSGGSISISGTLNSIASSPFTLEFFANTEFKADGFGEGKTYIGSTAVVTDGSGNASFNAFFTDAGYAGKFISATATDGARNTSEFAAVVVADGPAGAVQFGQAVYTLSEAGSFATIDVIRIAGRSGSISVNYTTSDGTATAGNDYTATSGILNFADGENYKSFNIAMTNDTANEPDETVNLSLRTPTGGVILGSLSNAVIVIQDNDPINLFAGDAAVTKLPSGTNTMLFPVSLSSASSRTVSVNYNTANITAEAGIDYLSVTGRVDFVPGVTNQFVPVTILADGLQEGSKSFLLNLSNPTNAIFGDSAALGTIYDGTQGVLQFNSATYAIAENGGAATITVTRTGGSLGTVSVPFSTSNGSATSGSDFTPTNGVLTFNNGQTSRSFTVPVINDLANEDDETVLLQLAIPTGTTLGNPPASVLTLQDDDLPPQLSIQLAPGAVVLLWPTQAANFQLESSLILSVSTWSPVTNSPGTMGNQFALTNLSNETNRFFRLRR